MKVACGFDHAGFELKDTVLAVVRAAGHEPIDLGTNSAEPVDYPDYALAVGRAVVAGEAERGILVCGSGAGVAVAASKIPGIWACSIHDHYTAAQGVQHDAVNVLCIGARVIGAKTAEDVIVAFLGATVSDEERHVRRRAKVRAIEEEGLGAEV